MTLPNPPAAAVFVDLTGSRERKVRRLARAGALLGAVVLSLTVLTLCGVIHLPLLSAPQRRPIPAARAHLGGAGRGPVSHPVSQQPVAAVGSSPPTAPAVSGSPSGSHTSVGSGHVAAAAALAHGGSNRSPRIAASAGTAATIGGSTTRSVHPSRAHLTPSHPAHPTQAHATPTHPAHPTSQGSAAGHSRARNGLHRSASPPLP